MKRVAFWLEKIRFTAAFVWWGNWGLVRDEWGMTYREWTEAEQNSDEICEKAIKRLMDASADPKE